MILQSDTEAWKAARLGCLTASRISDALAKTKSGWSTSRANYAAELVVERLTGTCGESGYINSAMQWGIDTEPQARDAYAFRFDASPGEGLFVKHGHIKWAGASTDGLVGDDGLIEIKCPLTATHLQTLMDKEPSPKYVTQIQWELACTNRKWADFVSFDPRLPERLRFFCKRVHRNEKTIHDLECAVEIFLSEVEDTIKRLQDGN